MSDHEDAPTWLNAFAQFLLIFGIGIVILSLFWPNTSTGRSSWSSEQALHYQAAASKLHSLSDEAYHSRKGGVNEPELRKKLAIAQADYDQLRSTLDSAIAWPKQVAIAMRIGGIFTGATGAYLIFSKRGSR